ncbi:hypothetical protein HDU99_002790 [Rhizoclosmatium hyalinum]|nr:hypothetical protein HDU99_002790 [Rhizoclosmatium hyalinum]
MSSAKVAQVQAQVQDAVGIMQNNIQKVAERGERLEDLNERSENLASSSQAFRNKSKEVRMKMFWQDAKTRLILGAVALVVIGCAIGFGVWASGVHNTPTPQVGLNPNFTATPTAKKA